MRIHPRIRPAGIAAAGFALALLASSAEPGQSPSEGPAPLSRYIPKENLGFYVEFDGLDAHAEAWRKTVAYKILNDTPTGAMLEDLFVQLVGKIPGAKLSGPEALMLLKHVAKSGFVFAAGGDPKKPAPEYLALVFRDAYKNKDVRAVAARAVMGTMFAPGAKLQSVLRAGHKVNSGPNPSGKTTTFWVEDSKKEDMVVAFPGPESADFILETLDEKRPSVTAEPFRADLLKGEDGFVPLLVAYVNTAVLELEKAPPALGLTGIKQLDYRWGFQDDALVSMTRIKAPSPRTGALALFDGPSFEKGSMPPIPESVLDFSVVAFDARETVAKVLAVAKTLRPDAEEKWNQAVDLVKTKTKVRLKEDILARLGPKAAWYIMPAKGGAPAMLAAPNMVSTVLAGYGVSEMPKVALILDVEDSAAFGKVLDELMAYTNRELKAQAAAKAPGGDAARNRRGPAPPSFEFRLMPGENKTYVLGVPPEMAAMVPPTLRPTVRLGPKHVVIAVNSEIARAALEAKAGSSPPTELAAAFRTLPSKLKFLSSADPKDTTPAILASMPAKLQSGINTMILQLKAMGGPMPAAPPAGVSNPPGAAKPADGPATIVLLVDAAKLPKADAIKALLYPTVVSTSVDEGGLTFVSRAAFPSVPDPSKIGSVAQIYLAMTGQAGKAVAPAPAGNPASPAGTPGSETPGAMPGRKRLGGPR